MAEMYLPVTDDVHDAIIDLHMRLQKVYGDSVTISDTIDFLGHQFFIHKRFLDVAGVQLEKMAEKKGEPSILDKALGAIGMGMPKDTTCFIRTDIEVPLHWVSTRWLRDIEGENILKCLSKPEEKIKKNEYKVDIH